jgi:hypothetical protein
VTLRVARSTAVTPLDRATKRRLVSGSTEAKSQPPSAPAMLPATTYSSLAATGVDAASKIANPQIELIERKCQFPSFERY